MAIATCLALLLLAHQPAATATLRGKVLDADGRPMAEATVVALAIGNDRDFIGLAALTKADGTFEITGVPATRIIVRAQPRLQIATGQTRTPLMMHPPAYFPGTLERQEAWAIDVKAGEVIELDINVPPVFIGSIKTTVSGPPGYQLEYLRVIRPQSNQIKNVPLSAGVGYADELREGRHVVTARARSGDMILVASQIVQMTGGEISVPLKLEPAATVRGRLVVANSGIPPPTDDVRVIATWTDRMIDLDPLARDEAYIQQGGTFAIDGLFGTRRFRVEGLPDSWRVSAIRHGGVDITSGGVALTPGSTTEIEIVVSRQ